MATDSIWLVELTGYTDASTSTVYRYSTGAYITKRTDTPAEVLYEDCVIDPGSISRQMYAGGGSGVTDNPRSEVGYGAITLANIDGHLDAIFDSPAISFRERQVRVLRVQPEAAYSTAVLILSAVISQIEAGFEKVTIGIKDRLYELASPHITTLYAGTNALPAGVEGVADLAGKPKPLVMGKVFSIEPPCVNTSRLIYQVSTAAITSGSVYDGGVALTAGAAYASQADMETTAPAAGQVRWWLAGGMFRLGSSPAFRVTADVVADSSASSTAAQILQRLALARGISSGDISAADVAAMDVLNSAVCGIYIDTQADTLELMDQIARSIGAGYGFDRTGVLRMWRFDAPSGSPLAVLADWNVGAVDRVANGEDIPTTTINLRYARYYTQQSATELAGAVTDAAVSDLAQEWRVSSYTGTLSPNPHKRTQTLQRDTLLTAKADADTEAARVYGITSVVRRTHKCSNVFLDDAALLVLDLNTVIALRWPRYGFDNTSGTLRRVIAITYFYAANRADLTVWGS